MRVLHVIPSLDPRDGGPSVALPLMARSLAMQGISVDVAATMSAEDAATLGVRFGEPHEREGFTVRFFRRQTGFYKFSLPLMRWLGDHAKDYALMHNHALFSFAPLAGAAAARRSGVPYLMRPLGLLNAWGMEQRRRWTKAASFRLLERPALDRAAVIHYTSKSEEREAARLRLRSRSVVVPLGIDTDALQNLPDREGFLTQHPAVRGRRIVLFLSRLDPKKGIELLLEAFAGVKREIPGAVLVLAGSGDPDYEARLKALAASLGLTDAVTWTGFLDGAGKRAALAAADMFVLPSYSENFGIALLEAMAAGLACVSSDQVALAAECGDAVRVVPCDAEALRDAIARLLNDEGARATLGRSAAAMARRHWSLQATGAQLAAVYREIVP